LTDRIDPPFSSIHFGFALTFAGNFLVVGAPESRSVFIFNRNVTGRWLVVAQLTNPAEGFGYSLSATTNNSNLFLAVGAPYGSVGRVFVYKYQSGFWNSVLNYTDGNTAFAQTLAFGGSMDLLIGSPRANNSQGVVAHFVYDGDTWKLFKNISSPTPRSSANFGAGLCGDPINADWLVGSSGTSDPVQFLSRRIGSVVVVYSINNTDSFPNNFGYSLSFDSKTHLMVIGADLDSTNFTKSGAVYVFFGPFFLRKLFSPNPSTNGYFGNSVVVFQQIFVVAAYGQNSNRGAVYVYEVPSFTTTTTLGNPVNIVPVPPSPPLVPSSPPSPPSFNSPVNSATTPSTTSKTPMTPTRPPFGFSSETSRIENVKLLITVFLLTTILLI
jgi:hypothetical protein